MDYTCTFTLVSILMNFFLVRVETLTICVSNASWDVALTDNCNMICNFSKIQLQPLEHNTIFELVNTTYKMNFTWYVDNLTNITLKAASSRNAYITCSDQKGSGIFFRHIENLTLTNLVFSHCGSILNIGSKLHKEEYTVSSTLLFYRGANVMMENVTMVNSATAAFCIVNIGGNIQLKNVKVTESQSLRQLFQSSSIIWYDTAVEHPEVSLNITSSNFLNNGRNHEDHSTISYSSSLLLFLNTSSNLTIKITNTTFDNNVGNKGGHLSVILHATERYLETPIITLNGVRFQHGTAYLGGAIYMTIIPSGIQGGVNAIKVIMNNCSFINNTAKKKGGGILLLASHGIQRTIDIRIKGSNFSGNQLAEGPGGLAVHLYNYVLSQDSPLVRSKFKVIVFFESCYFYNHTARSRFEPKSGVILSESMPFIEVHNVNIINNNCRGILAVNSIILFQNDSNISNNNATSGAGIRLCSDSFLYFAPHTKLHITHNKASTIGGGISVDSKCLIDETLCFYQYSHSTQMNSSLTQSVDFFVQNNTARSAGDNLYGGSIKKCYFLHSRKSKVWINTPLNTDSLSSVSSNPQEVCILRGINDRECNKSKYISIYPGQEICFYFRVVGQFRGAVPGIVTANLKGENISLSPSQITQDITNNEGQRVCYSMYSNSMNVVKYSKVTMHVGNGLESKCYSLLNNTIIYINFSECPLGSTIQNGRNDSYYGCKCNTTYFEKTGCAEEFPKFVKKRRAWIGIVRTHKVFYVSSSYCLHCKTSLTAVDPNKSDEQCLYNRTGIMCGSCPSGWSLQFGSSRCVQHCSDIHLLLAIPFALIGLLLVLLIASLNLTVTAGTINGIIFYANIVKDNSLDDILTEYYVPVLSPILSTYISWVNLDLGIPTCFYREMGAIGKTLVPGIFALYLWAIACIIVVLSKKYVFVTHLLGNNAVKVLATLILLSYSKLLRVTVGLFSFVNVIYFDPITDKFEHRPKWVFNGNLDFTFPNGNFLALVIASAFAAILLPFTLSLLFVQHTSKISNYCKYITFIDKMKPFFDAYIGIMKDKARFWPGLLLLCRILVLLVNAIFPKDLYFVHYITLLACIFLSLIMVLLRGVYTLSYLNILEYTFLANILALLTSLISLASTNYIYRKWITFSLVSLSFFVTIGVLLHHVYLKILQCRWVKRVFGKRNENTGLVNSQSYETRQGYTQIDSDNEETNSNSIMTELAAKSTHPA